MNDNAKVYINCQCYIKQVYCINQVSTEHITDLY